MQTVRQIITAAKNREIRVSLTKKLSIPRLAEGRRWTMQGGATDGTYAYYAMNSGGDSRESLTRIHKVELATWEIVQISRPLYMSHSNDIAYDPAHRRLVISWCDIEPDKVAIVDPDTLELTETLQIPQKHFSIAYNDTRGLYVTGKSRTYDLVLLDREFQPVRLLPGSEGYVKQGLECDEDYIYFFQSGTDANRILVFDWDGTPIRTITIPLPAEGENLFVLGDKLICAFHDKANDEGSVYEVSLTMAE